jgi:hypothetical protein
MIMEVEVPILMSKARAAVIAGISRPTLDRWLRDDLLTTHGAFNQISRGELENLLGRSITMAVWDAATLKLNHEAIKRHTEASEAF